jgi:predicted transcriptional regulator
MRDSIPVKVNRVQVSIQLDADQAEALDRIASKRRVSRAAIARAAVDLYLISNMDDAHSGNNHLREAVAA